MLTIHRLPNAKMVAELKRLSLRHTGKKMDMATRYQEWWDAQEEEEEVCSCPAI
jgi:hypothetical protein